MCAEGALCTPDCKQQINSSFVIWFGRKQVFWGERSTFPIQMNQSIFAFSWGLPAGEPGGERAEKRSVSFFSLISSTPCFLSPCFAHLFSTLTNTHSASKVLHLSVCVPSPSSSLSASFSPYLLSFYNTTHVAFLWCICNPEKRGGGGEKRRGE